MHAALTVLVFVAGGLFGVVHEAAIQHVRCAEHGELTHTASDSPLAISAEPARDSVVHQGPGPTVHEHEHCGLASAVRESRLAPRASAIVPAITATSRAVITAARAAAPRRTSLYRTAPKTSPPA